MVRPTVKLLLADVDGTLVTQEANTILIEADALSIPQSLTVSVEGAAAGTQFTAGQIPLPEGVNLIADPDSLVVNVVVAPTEEDLESEGAGAAGEGEQPAEGEDDGEASEAESESE